MQLIYEICLETTLLSCDLTFEEIVGSFILIFSVILV